MLRYLSADIFCSEKRTVFRERNSRKTVSFEEQIRMLRALWSYTELSLTNHSACLTLAIL